MPFVVNASRALSINVLLQFQIVGTGMSDNNVEKNPRLHLHAHVVAAGVTRYAALYMVDAPTGRKEEMLIIVVVIDMICSAAGPLCG